MTDDTMKGAPGEHAPRTSTIAWHMARLECTEGQDSDWLELLLPLNAAKHVVTSDSRPMLFRGTWAGELLFGEFTQRANGSLVFKWSDGEVMPTDFGTAIVKLSQRIWIECDGVKYAFRVKTLEPLDHA
jgi:hypothetical protein